MTNVNFDIDIDIDSGASCPKCGGANNSAVFAGTCCDCGGNSGDGGYCYRCGGTNITSHVSCSDCGTTWNPDQPIWDYMKQQHPAAAGFAIVCGGYIVFDTIAEHDTWLKQI